MSSPREAHTNEVCILTVSAAQPIHLVKHWDFNIIIVLDVADVDFLQSSCLLLTTDGDVGDPERVGVQDKQQEVQASTGVGQLGECI